MAEIIDFEDAQIDLWQSQLKQVCKCLKCKHIDDSDLPNFFCGITGDFLNESPDKIIKCPKVRSNNGN